MEAYLTGNVTDEGDVKLGDTDSSKEARWAWDELCERLVPNLRIRIKEQVDKNFKDEAKNRLGPTGERPEHKMLSSKFIITPYMIDMYRQMLEDEDLAIDADHPDDCELLWKGLQRIVEEQYDFEKWNHVSVSKKPMFKQVPLLNDADSSEKFSFNADEPDKISVVFKQKIPADNGGGWYRQADLIPEINDSGDQSDKNKYLLPDPQDRSIPKKKDGQLWKPTDSSKRTWKRGDGETWTFTALFRCFQRSNDEYIGKYLVSFKFYDNIDLNDKEYVKTYNKLLSQWRRRVMHVRTRIRDHWSEEEAAFVYTLINTWIKENGIEKFDIKAVYAERQSWVASLNKAFNATRTEDSLVSWVRNKTKAPKHPLGILTKRVNGIKDRIEADEDVAKKDRFPDEAIPLDKKTAEKRKHRADTESESEKEELDIVNDPREYEFDDEEVDDNAGEGSSRSAPKRRKTAATFKFKKTKAQELAEQTEAQMPREEHEDDEDDDELFMAGFDE